MKIVILTVGLLLFCFVARSQKISSVSVNYGITRSDLDWKFDDDSSYINLGGLGSKSISGFYCSVNMAAFETKYLSLESGAGFCQKGGLDEFRSSLKWSLDYLTLDTKLKAKIRIKNLSPYVVAGPRLDYLLRYSAEFDEFDRLAKLSRVNYGLRGGIGLQYFFDNFFAGIGWENNFSFNPIVDNNGEYMRPTFTIKDNTMIFKCEVGILLSR